MVAAARSPLRCAADSQLLCFRSWSQCKKIVDTPFPYPYAQSVMLMVCLYTILAPFLVCQIVNSDIHALVPYLLCCALTRSLYADAAWAIFITFIAVGSYTTLNEVRLRTRS